MDNIRHPCPSHRNTAHYCCGGISNCNDAILHNAVFAHLITGNVKYNYIVAIICFNDEKNVRNVGTATQPPSSQPITDAHSSKRTLKQKERTTHHYGFDLWRHEDCSLRHASTGLSPLAPYCTAVSQSIQFTIYFICNPFSLWYTNMLRVYAFPHSIRVGTLYGTVFNVSVSLLFQNYFNRIMPSSVLSTIYNKPSGPQNKI